MKKGILGLITAVLLIGCAATPTIKTSDPITSGLASQYKTVHVIVDAPKNIRETAGFEVTSSTLLKEFTDNLKATGKYSIVGPEVKTGRVLVTQLTITDLNYVHGATRGTVGIFGGRAVLNVTMTLKDRESNAPLGEITAGHSSHMGQGVFSPVTSTQITAIAKELSAKLAQ